MHLFYEPSCTYDHIYEKKAFIHVRQCRHMHIPFVCARILIDIYVRRLRSAVVELANASDTRRSHDFRSRVRIVILGHHILPYSGLVGFLLTHSYANS